MAIERKNQAPERTISPFPIQDDRRDESSVRPTRFAEYIGQQNVRERVEVCVRAALMRDEPLDHVLLSGPPGLGKTTLARIIAHEMGVNIFTTSGPALDRKGDLAGILTSLEPRDILFIDEIHRLNPAVEENLYPAMEEFTFDIIVGTGPGANTIRLPLNPFTLIGATTRTGLLTSPLRSRFGIVERLDLYNVPELVQIVMRSAEILHFELTEEGGTELGRRSRGTPRIVNRLLRRVSDYALVNDTPIIDLEVARHALEQLEIDEYGFDSTDRLLLSTLVNTFEGGPVGLDTLAAATGESSDAIEDVYEPYFIQLGFIQRTPRGRVATGRAFEYFGKSRPQGSGQGTIPLE